MIILLNSLSHKCHNKKSKLSYIQSHHSNNNYNIYPIKRKASYDQQQSYSIICYIKNKTEVQITQEILIEFCVFKAKQLIMFVKIYVQLTGTVTNYGETHSEQYRQGRFGRKPSLCCTAHPAIH